MRVKSPVFQEERSRVSNGNTFNPLSMELVRMIEFDIDEYVMSHVFRILDELDLYSVTQLHQDRLY
jgi:hypothetical protein